MVSSELLSCPFCKEQERLFVQRSIGDAYWGKCLECGAEGPLARTEQEATNAWNARAERTCYNNSVHEEDFLCSSCNHAEIGGGWFNACPNCGAEVVE